MNKEYSLQTEEALLYLWHQYVIERWPSPVPPKWYHYSLWQIVEWCKKDKQEWQYWQERMDRIELELFPTQRKGDDNVEELFLTLDLVEAYEIALSELEIATTNFIVRGLKYMTELPKDELESLLPILTKARKLLGRI